MKNFLHVDLYPAWCDCPAGGRSLTSVGRANPPSGSTVRQQNPPACVRLTAYGRGLEYGRPWRRVGSKEPMGPAVVKSSLQVVMVTREGCLPLLTLSGMVSGEARQIKVFEQHRRRHVRKC